MSHSEQDRKAFNSSLALTNRKKAVAEWLKANPEIGALNGGKYYRVINGQAIPVQELTND